MTTKKKSTGKAKSGMSDESRAAWRASKSADLGRAAALKKLVATPPAPATTKAPKAASPKRAHPAPNDATKSATVHEGKAFRPDGTEVLVTVPGDEPANPTASGTPAEVPVQGPEQNGPADKKGKRKQKHERTPGSLKPLARPRADGCLTIAARLLAESTTPLGTKTLIETMASRGLWTSPGGKTPAATLYAAIVREITTKGKDARFRKADRGLFTANTITST